MSRAYISAELRREVIQWAGNCCEYCRVSQADQFFAFEIDHIISQKHGGPTESFNLCLSCPECNAFKGSDIASVDWDGGGTIVALYHPRQNAWATHFGIDTETGRIIPLTSQGRVTIFMLRINEPKRIEDRKLLLDENRYPCQKAN